MSEDVYVGDSLRFIFFIKLERRGPSINSLDPGKGPGARGLAAWYLGQQVSVKPKGVSKRMVFKMVCLLEFKIWHFGTRLFWYPFGCLQKFMLVL